MPPGAVDDKALAKAIFLLCQGSAFAFSASENSARSSIASYAVGLLDLSGSLVLLFRSSLSLS